MKLSAFPRTLAAPVAAVAAALGLLFSAGNASAYIVILDLDPSTAPVETFPSSGFLAGPPGPATGFESTVSAKPGVAFPVTAYLVFEATDFGLGFDFVGIDINSKLGGEAASLSISGPASFPGFGPVAGSLASMPTEGSSVDYFDSTIETTGFIDPMGKGLKEDAVPALAPFTASMGGVGFFDDPFMSGGGGPDSIQFGGFGSPGTHFALEFIDLVDLEFMLSGPLGSTVTFSPTGIFDPTTGAPFTAPAPLAGGEAVYSSIFGSFSAIPGTFIGGNVGTVVPEPSRALLALLGLGAILLRRRR